MDESLCFLDNGCLGFSSAVIPKMSMLLLLKRLLPPRPGSSAKRGLSFRERTEQKEDLDSDQNTTELIRNGIRFASLYPRKGGMGYAFSL